MRFFLSVLFIIVLSAVATFFLPWWLFGICAFVVALAMMLRPASAFFAGFMAIAIFWLVVILLHDIPNQHILSERMSKLFGLPNFSLFIVVNVFLGALLGGLAAWSGGLMNKAFRK